MHDSGDLGGNKATERGQTFGALLRECRLRSSLTQETLAERAGVSPRTVQDLEHGSARPRTTTLGRLLEALALTGPESARLRAAATPTPRHRRVGMARADLRHNLPLELTSFVGREVQLADLVKLLETNRLLTLTGVGGVGKTRLALCLAHRVLGSFTDGEWFAQLSPVVDAQLVAQSVSDALGIREQPGRPLRETLLAALKSRRVLLILDNCEHLLDSCADLTSALLHGCPALRVVATSREPLGVTGEVVYPVPPLAASLESDAQAVRQSEAGQLLLARTQARQPAFSISERDALAVAEVCRRLDGIPLALELVAPRLAALGAEHLLAQLSHTLSTIGNLRRDAAPRQLSLSATMQWSYDLLPEHERVLFRRLSVFVGTWTLQSAVMVCDLSHTECVDVPRLLSSLIDKSLVVVDNTESQSPRYRLLHVVRQFAAGVLEAHGEVIAMRDRHASYFLSVVEQLQPQPGPPERDAIDAIDCEYADALAALDWLIEREQADASMRLGAALVNFWINRGHVTEGLERINRLLRLATSPTVAYGAALRAAGRLAWASGDYHARRRFAERSLAAFRHVSDDVGIGLSLQDLTSVAIQEGAYDTARELAHESLRLWETLGDRGRIARSQLALGHLARDQGQFAAAWSAYEACLRGAANRAQYGNAVTHMGWLAFYAGDLEHARMLAETGRRIACDLGEMLEATVCLTLLAKIAFAIGDRSVAIGAYAQSLSDHIKFGNQWGAVVAVAGIAELAAAVPDEAAAALRIAASACELRMAMGRPLSPAEQIQLNRGLTAARRHLTKSRQQLTWAEGRTLSLKEAVAEARQLLQRCAAYPRQPDDATGLSRREREVAVLIARGLTNREIADELVISSRTAETYVERILNKLGFRTRSQVAAWAAAQHVVASERRGFDVAS